MIGGPGVRVVETTPSPTQKRYHIVSSPRTAVPSDPCGRSAQSGEPKPPRLSTRGTGGAQYQVSFRTPLGRDLGPMGRAGTHPAIAKGLAGLAPAAGSAVHGAR